MKVSSYLLLVVLAVVSCRPHGSHKELEFQGDHFFSEKEKSASYTLSNLTSNHPLVVILKSKNHKDEDVDAPLQQAVTISIVEDGTLRKNCTFKRMNNLCRLDSVKSATNTLVKVACEKTPCDVIFQAFQPSMSELDVDKEVPVKSFNLYNVSVDSPALELVSNSTKIESIAEEIALYTNGNYEVLDNGAILLVAFQGQLQDFFIEGDPHIIKHVNMKVSENPDEVGLNKEQRAIVLGSRQIHLKMLPQKEMRLEMSISSMRTQEPLQPFGVEFFGYNKKENKTSLVRFDIEPEGQLPSLDANIILKHAQFGKHELVNFTIGSKQAIALMFRVIDTDVHELDVEQQSYFELEKGQTLKYKILGESTSDEKKEIYVAVITQGAEGKVDLKLSEKPCLYSKGCTLEISTKESIQAGILVSLDKTIVSEVKYITLEKALTLELREGDRKYMLFNSTTPKDRLLTVNTNNVLVYASTNETCKIPSRKCADYVGNAEDPILIENQTGPLYISIQSLEIVKATIRIDDKDGAFQLQDGIPLTYSPGKSKEVYFKFNLPNKKPVNFNLVAPLNSFVMVVANSKEKPGEDDVDLPTSSTFLKFDQDVIEGLSFTVLVKRVTNKTDENFVLIASTKDSVITLDRSEPHEDVLEPSTPRYFAILIDFEELQGDVESLINFHIFQQTTNLNISMRLSTNVKKFQMEPINITKSPQLVSLNKYTTALCEQEPDEADTCHIFLQITNHNSQQLDVTLSVLGSNSVVKLRSGIWQSFVLNEITSSNHFTFVPTNKHYPISLQFTHNFGEFRLAYTLFNNKLKEDNSAKWPFPDARTMPDLEGGMFQGNDYSIPAEEIGKCYPDCILLITLWGQNVLGSNLFGSYRIMASDDVIELVEEHKIPISLANGQTKSLLIDLQHYIESDKTVTILTSPVLGFHECFASLITNHEMKMPNEHVFDYRLDADETQLTMVDLRQKLEAKKLNVKDDAKLALYCKGFQTNRFMVQFTTNENPIQKLMVGQPQQITIPPKGQKYLSTEHYMDYRVKITRNQGYPQLAYTGCKRSEMEQCYQRLSAMKTDKATDKVIEIREKWAPSSLLLIRVVSTDEKVVFDAVAVSQFTAVDLREGQVTTDILSSNSSNLYKLHATRNQTTTVTVTIFEGNPSMRVFNLMENINHNASRHGNTLSAVIGAGDFRNVQPGENHDKPMITTFAFSQVLTELMVEVRSDSGNASYSISYSLGERSLVLQDGVLSSAILKKQEKIIFNYHNYGHGMNSIVSVSFTDSEMMDGCQIQISQAIGSEEPVVHTPDKLQTKKKLPRPTMTFHLSESYSDYEIIIHNTKAKDAELNIIINHQDIILLPYAYEYSSFVGKNQTSDLILWVSNEGYVEFLIRKCSEADLTFAYALDDESYQKQQFTSENQIDQHFYTAFVKAHVGSIYIRISSNEGSLFSIQAEHYKDKRDVPISDYKPGNKGLIEYTTISDKQVEVSFSPIECKGQCPEAIYYYLLNTKQQNVVSQVACPGSFFLFQSSEVILPNIIKAEKGSDKKLKFKLNLTNEIEFLGIKAIIEHVRQVPYPVIELATFWGGVQKSRHWLLLTSGLLVLGMLLCVLAVIRRRNRMKYEQLPQAFDPTA